MPGDPPSTLLAALEQVLAEDGCGPAIEPGTPAARGIARALIAPAAEILRRPGKRLRARLVEAGWSLAGGEGDPPAQLPLLVEVLHAGSLVVDDIEDGSTHRRGEPALHHKVGLPLALNTGNWLYFWPFELLGTLGLEAEVELAMRRRMTRALYHGHLGQALDLGTRAEQVPQPEIAGLADAIARLKTGELMALAATLAPTVAGAPEACTRALEAFGVAFGTALQMFDDLGNLAGRRDPHKRHEDLRLGRVGFAWARLAETLDPVEFAALQEQAQRVRSGDEEPEALAERMRMALGPAPCAPAREALARALAELAGALGPHAALTSLAEELWQLDARHG